MKCRQCNSNNTRTTCTQHKGNETWRYCRCLDCDFRYKTIETYAILKGGSVPGKSQHPNCSLSNVLEIRKLASENQTYAVIAKRFGIHKDTVYRIVKRKRWSHV
jgi:transcriptional regulator NrdR family protein